MTKQAVDQPISSKEAKGSRNRQDLRLQLGSDLAVHHENKFCIAFFFLRLLYNLLRRHITSHHITSHHITTHSTHLTHSLHHHTKKNIYILTREKYISRQRSRITQSRLTMKQRRTSANVVNRFVHHASFTFSSWRALCGRGGCGRDSFHVCMCVHRLCCGKQIRCVGSAYTG